MRGRIQKALAVMAAVAVTVTSTGVASVDAQAATVKPKKLTVTSSVSSKVIDVKGTTKISVKRVSPKNASKSVTYKSSNTKIASVSSKGTVKGKKTGSVTITATSKVNKKVKASVKLKVKDLKPSKVSIPAALSLTNGKKAIVKATVSPAGVYAPVKFGSSNTKVATVSSTGTVTAKSAGKAVITAKLTQKNSKGKYLTAKTTVTVKKAETKPEEVPSAKKTDVFVSPAYIKSVMDGKQEESKNYVILDTSTEAAPYNEGHIPGAYHCSVRQVESSTYAAYANNTIDYTDENLGNLHEPAELAALLKKYNITKDTMVILYGAHPATERVAFCFLYCGVENVKVLNGSLTNWKNAGYEVETKVNTPVTDANYDFGTTVPAHPEYIVSKEELKDKLANDKNFRLVSIRSLDEFKGLSDGNYPMLQEKGEIAGAVFGRAGNDANTMEEYMNADGTLISYERFKGFMADSYVYPTNEVCFFCGTGWRATMPLLMAYEKGWKVSLYDGGWWQWTRDLEHNAIQMLTPEQARTCSSFEYTNMDVKLQVGDTYKNSDIHIFPASGTLPTVRFKSNNTNVATVDADGNVTAVGAGTVNIKMIATDFSGRNTSYTVTVTEKQAAQSTKKAEKTVKTEEPSQTDAQADDK
ncbi:MAG: Ig-like domain-containing protein [Dorea sp.]